MPGRRRPPGGRKEERPAVPAGYYGSMAAGSIVGAMRSDNGGPDMLLSHPAVQGGASPSQGSSTASSRRGAGQAASRGAKPKARAGTFSPPTRVELVSPLAGWVRVVEAELLEAEEEAAPTPRRGDAAWRRAWLSLSVNSLAFHADSSKTVRIAVLPLRRVASLVVPPAPGALAATSCCAGASSSFSGTALAAASEATPATRGAGEATAPLLLSLHLHLPPTKLPGLVCRSGAPPPDAGLGQAREAPQARLELRFSDADARRRWEIAICGALYPSQRPLMQPAAPLPPATPLNPNAFVFTPSGQSGEGCGSRGGFASGGSGGSGARGVCGCNGRYGAGSGGSSGRRGGGYGYSNGGGRSLGTSYGSCAAAAATAASASAASATSERE
mmetsp:Transcript_36812/g.119092  ORF Transcript_36812/g.119092 Transcript_36812/m.119092 type:complete len:387 (-) Transcript_36812:311-1471(-)